MSQQIDSCLGVCTYSTMSTFSTSIPSSTRRYTPLLAAGADVGFEEFVDLFRAQVGPKDRARDDEAG